jgi:hypothetical protein
MRRSRAARAARGALALCGAAMLFCAVPAAAGADVFGPISLVSEGTVGGSAPQQAEYAHDAAISGDGRYVAFDGSVGGAIGVWRRNLATGAVEQVAGGDAELPSISEDGRYISFTSDENLAPEDEAHGVNVWVRDMEPGPGEPEYILASAVNHSTKGLTYAYGASPPGEEELAYGAVAAGRSAISADGQEVAFVTTAVSDLVLSPAEADGEEPVRVQTPAFQVAVRDIPAEETTLISGEYEPLTGATTDRPVSVDEGGVPIGAVYPGQKSFRPVPANGGWQHGPPGASISADGSTVAWMGENIGRQARMLPGESPSPLYTEPLWRRIAPGSQTPTERVTGGSDPGNPACVASGELGSAPACQGPFNVSLHPFETGKTAGIWSEAGGGGQGDPVPRLSATGEEVAFLSTALPVAIGAGFGTENAGEPADLYVVDMDSNPTRLTRDQALTPLTRIGGANEAADEPITDFDISPNGDQVAFTTARIEFPLGSPAYVSEPAAEAGESELFDVDLTDDTLTRVTHGYDGGPSEQPHLSKVTTGGHDPYQYGLSTPTTGAQSPSFTAGGDMLAFSSTASNLVYGDGNTAGTKVTEKLPDGSDAFVVQREAFAPLPTPQYISPAPLEPLTSRWILSATALSRRDGSVLLDVEVPGPGTLYVAARSSVLVVRSSARTAKRGHARRASREADPRETVATRTVAAASELLGAGGGEVAELVLRLARPYAPLAAHGGGLSAEVSLTFTASGRPALRQSIATTFVRTIPAHVSRRRRASVRRPRAHR